MRTLTPDMEQVNSSISRRYRYRLEIWDIITPGAPTISDIIDGIAESSFMIDVTSYVENGMTLQEPGDRRAARLSFSLVDSTTRFHPDYGQDLNYIQSNQVVRLIEGDEDLNDNDWVVTFTGHIMGQVGFKYDRQSLLFSTDIVAYSRRATPTYLKKTFLSKTYGRRIDYGEIIQDIATEQMNLSATELERVPSILGKATQFEANSIVDMTPLEAIDKILETVGMVSDFDGEGRLRFYSRDLTRGSDKIYSDQQLIGRYTIPSTENEPYNSIKVIGLDKQLSIIEQPEQALARATIPVGFWRPSEDVVVQWSQDRSLRAINTRMVTIHSVNDAIIGSFADETYEAIDDFSGRIHVSIEDYVEGLITLIVVTLAAKATIGDLVVIPPLGGITTTISVGRILQVAVEIEIYLIMATISSGQYEIWGIPLLPVYKEIEVVVSDDSVPDYLIREREIRNDWLNEQNEMIDIAKLELIFERGQGNLREYTVYNDLQLEIGDIVTLPIGEGIRVWVEGISKTISRNAVPMMQVTCYRCP